MTADEFGSRMHYDIRAVFNGTQFIRGCKRIIYYEGNTVFMREFRGGFNICDGRVRVTQAFYKNGFGVRAYGVFNIIDITGIYKCSLYTTFDQRIREKAVRTAVNGNIRYDMITGFGDILCGIRYCRRAGSRCERFSGGGRMSGCKSLFGIRERKRRINGKSERRYLR